MRAQTTDYPSTRNQNVLLAKVDYQLNAKHRLSLRYNHQNFTGANTESTSGSLDHSGDTLVRTRTFNAALSSVMSPTFYNEFRAQVARDKEPGLANSDAPAPSGPWAGSSVVCPPVEGISLRKEVKEGSFPDDDHSYTVKEEEYEKFAKMVQKRKHI